MASRSDASSTGLDTLDGVKRPTLVIVGALLVVVGVIWTLQGTGRLGGSVMSGVTAWAVIGPVVGVVGLVLAYFGWTREHSGPRR